MARENNFLLGNGEKLTRLVQVPSGGGDKAAPYSFTAAQKHSRAALETVVADLSTLPPAACPDDQGVALVTMHPRYVSKTAFPETLLAAVGLRAIGSRPRSVTPRRWGVKKHPESAVSEEIFVAGTRQNFEKWTRELPAWTERTRGAAELPSVEEITPFRSADKLRSVPVGAVEAAFEIVLHNAGMAHIPDAFAAYAESLGARVLMDRRRTVGGLTFLPIRSAASRVEEIARFSFVRIARAMPSLRPIPPRILRGVSGRPVTLPSGPPLNKALRAVIFDGGLPDDSLSEWARAVEPPGIGAAVPDFQAHGLGVTSALLFGPVDTGRPLPLPLCGVDHVRVLDADTATTNDLQYYDVLVRILKHLDANPSRYDFVSLSIGPQLAVDDNDVSVWTAEFDPRLASGRMLATSAVGNDGELDAKAGLNRIQPPSDAVNMLSIGAADSQGATWARAVYSCIGRGRCPGLVKPDGITFGGSDAEPFMLLVPSGVPRVDGDQGTSYAGPYGLRQGISIGAQIGPAATSLLIRALMIHRAEPGAHSQVDVGWGRFEADPLRLITCDDDEAIVLFKGELPIGQHLRAPIPLPESGLVGEITITATLVISPQVEPQFPGMYTQSGFEVAFRPNASRHRVTNGKRSKHPITRPFFSPRNLYGASEYLLREGGHKWEPCRRGTLRYRRPAPLHRPCFDIYHHTRENGGRSTQPMPIPYALVVSVKAPKVPDLYNKVVRAYANVLVPLRPQLRIPVTL